MLGFESEQVSHAEGVNAPLRPSVGIGYVVDQLDVVDLLVTVGLHDLERALESPSVG